MDFLSGIFQQQMEGERLTELKKKLKPASLRGKKSCVKCGFCCHMRTCVPTPNELKRIAKYLNLTPEKLIKKYYAIDRNSDSSDYFVKPLGINIKDLAGKFIPSDRTFNEGKCVFLDKDSLCKIYSVRPQHAKKAQCWKSGESEYNVFKFWEKNKLLKQFGIDGKKLEELLDL